MICEECKKDIEKGLLLAVIDMATGVIHNICIWCRAKISDRVDFK